LFSNDTLTREYNAFYGAVFSLHPSLQERVRDFHKDVGDKINRLESINGRLVLIPVSTSAANVPTAVPSLKPTGKKVFVVHGHDEGAREATARFLERLEVQPIVLHEMASGGRTIIEKLEQYSDVDFAVILLTPDDVGAVATAAERLSPRARQNVILELGFFVGKLGRNHVCALHKGSVELPSDFFGVVYVPMDDGTGWKVLLAKELREAGFNVDLNSAL
jgi:predicted nucleotide-binding protein